MRIYSVSEYRDELNELMESVTVAIEAEITSFNMSQNRFVWFTLSDDKTVIDCFMLMYEMREPLAEGMRVRVVGSPNMFKKGKLVFRPRQIEVVGDGDLQRAYEKLRAQLEKEGLFDIARKRALPLVPRRIALLTSRDAAAYTDVLRVIENRYPAVEITLMHVQVQGDAAVSSIVAGLNRLYTEHAARTAESAASGEAAPYFDALLITRGGGSMEDLQAFNTEEVARAVFAAPMPVISAIGHERDTTLIDFVADVRAATPSNAAELLTPFKEDMLQMIDDWVERGKRTVQSRIEQQQHSVDLILQRLKNVSTHFSALEQRLEYRLHTAAQALIFQIQTYQASIQNIEKRIIQLHPREVLKKGYAIVRSADGVLVREKNQAKKEALLTIEFQDGNVQVSV